MQKKNAKRSTALSEEQFEQKYASLFAEDDLCVPDENSAALASNGGQDLTDIEWERTAARLLEFVTILRVWDHQSKTRKPGANGEDSDDAIRKAA